MTTGPTAGQPSWLARACRIAIVVEFVGAIAIIVYAGLHDVSDVFRGAPPAVPARIAGSCVAAEQTAACELSFVELNPGRFRVETSVPAAALVLNLSTKLPERVHQALVRVFQPSSLRLDIRTDGAAATLESVQVTDEARAIVAIPAGDSVTMSFVRDSASAPAAIVLDEVGLFENDIGVRSDVRPFFRSIPPRRYHGTLVMRAIASLCLFTLLAASFVPPNLLRRYGPFVLSLVCFSLCLLDLAVLYSPYFARDLRVFYAGGPVRDPPGANLNGGLHQGLRFLQGQGLTFMDGLVPWERMPGYALFCAAAGALFGHRSLLDVAMSTILLQTLFYSAAVGALAWGASLLFSPAAVWAVGMSIAWLPKELGLTQVDAVIAPVSMLVLTALCVRWRFVRDGRPVPAALDAAVHLTFALWFVMRPDVLPGWLVVSVFLHWRDWRRLTIPIVLFLVIGGSWGAYRARYTKEFSLTTTSAGASLFCGLWEVPSRFRYALACTDETYFDWIKQNTAYRPQTAAASNFATREVLRFWMTYPGHLVIMVYHKMMQTLNGDLWPGFPTALQVFVFEMVPRYWLVMPLVTVVALCVVVGYQSARTLLLAWPLLFDAPIFWVMFASLGRFYSAVGIALIVAAVPPLFEKAFYASMAARPWRTMTVLACAGVFTFTAWPLHAWLLSNDAFHYWTPFLDPAGSPLSVFK